MSDFNKSNGWEPDFNSQNKLLDEHSERYALQVKDWRQENPWYKPDKD